MDNSIIEMLYQTAKEDPEIMQRITFEILESESIHDYSVIKNFVKDVKALGAKVAIDDFGSGYSNFEHILNLDIDYLKIDGSLIKNLDKDDTKMELIIETIVSFSKKTNIETIAEFVHSKKVYEKVKKLNLNYSQGFYFSEPKGEIN